MIQQAIEEIARMATQAIKPVVINPGEDPRTRLLVMPDGKLQKFDVPPPPHNEMILTVPDFGRFVSEQMAEGDPIVYVTMAGMVALYDKKDRRDRAKLKLELSEQWQSLVGLKTRKEYSQRDFYRLLRVGFADCLADDRLISLVKAIKWQTSDSGQSAVSNASHTMGRQLVAEVTGADAVPEDARLNVPVWDGVPFRASIRCAVEVYPENRTFALMPFPGQIDAAEEEAMRFVAATVKADIPETVKVYLGNPKE